MSSQFVANFVKSFRFTDLWLAGSALYNSAGDVSGRYNVPSPGV